MKTGEIKEIFKACKGFLKNDGLKTQDVQLTQFVL